MTDKETAIRALAPTAQWILRGDELEWHSEDIAQPSDEAINTKIAELVAAEPMRLLRVQRDSLLAATDWWALSDLTMTSAQTVYRQALRDITTSATSLNDVVWPTKP
jgi:hypothetical protein